MPTLKGSAHLLKAAGAGGQPRPNRLEAKTAARHIGTWWIVMVGGPLQADPGEFPSRRMPPQ